MKEKIIEYLVKTYNPEAIITYGSYADGTANANSDFDALIIASTSKVHDESVVDGVTLDVFIYPSEMDIDNIDPDEFIQIHDGIIELDKGGIAAKLKEREGYFRWHWLLTESLEIYFDIIRERYWGPKKALLKLRKSNSEAYEIYEAALKNFDRGSLSDWIAYLEKSLGGQQ